MATPDGDDSNLPKEVYDTVNCGAICNGNRTEWSPIWSVIIQVLTKSDDRAAGVRLVYQEYD